MKSFSWNERAFAFALNASSYPCNLRRARRIGFATIDRSVFPTRSKNERASRVLLRRLGVVR